MKRVLVNTAENVHAYRMNITLAILFASAICAAFYAMNLYSLVSRTVAIRQVERQLTSVSSAISDLDSQYLILTSNITPDTLASHGFTAGKIAAYIKRSQATASAQPTLVASAGHEL
ncbi:MAG TPA: hypothetical protein VF438_02670 [Candidatus Paceibacterota bacterium]